jgi:hypothetical protein
MILGIVIILQFKISNNIVRLVWTSTWIRRCYACPVTTGPFTSSQSTVERKTSNLGIWKCLLKVYRLIILLLKFLGWFFVIEVDKLIIKTDRVRVSVTSMIALICWICWSFQSCFCRFSAKVLQLAVELDEVWRPWFYAVSMCVRGRFVFCDRWGRGA